MDKNSFIQELYEKGCIKIKKGKLYVDLQIVIGYPYLLHFISETFLKESQTLNIDAIVGMPYSGIIHASYLSCKLNKSMCIIKTEKQLQRELENPENIINNKENKKINILLVLDSIEKGFKLGNYINTINKRIGNCNIVSIFTIYNSCTANNKYLHLSDYYIYSIINTHDILNNLIRFKNINNQEFLEIYNRMNFNEKKRNVLDMNKKSLGRLFRIIKSKKTNLLVSMYYSNFNNIVSVLTRIAPFICGIAINTNIIDKFSTEKGELLRKIAIEKDIIILNNLECSFSNKNLGLKTLERNFDFSDIITVRINYDEETKLFNEFNLSLLKHMKDKEKSIFLVMKGKGYNNNFVNQKVLDSCKKYLHLIGGIIVTKKEYYMDSTKYLFITDETDMIENTPQQAILELGCDLVIFNTTEYTKLTNEYIDGIVSSVQINRNSSWTSFCKANSINI
jgi:orotate phosphoribosyltransferase